MNSIRHPLNLALLVALALPVVTANANPLAATNGPAAQTELPTRLAPVPATELQPDGQSPVLPSPAVPHPIDIINNLVDALGLDEIRIVPTQIGEHVRIDGDISGEFARLSGAEINARAELSIWLQEERQYDVYHISSDFSISVTDPTGAVLPETLTISAPPTGGILLIVDLTDPFYYVEATVPFAGSLGQGRSKGGHIPFVPSQPHASLDMFDGHHITKGKMSFGVKVFDVIEIEGTRVIHQPKLAHIDFDDAFNSPLAYKMGINGSAAFGLSVLDVGDFPFELAEISGTMDVGLQRQHLAMQGHIEPDVSWIPEWVPLVPAHRLDARFFVDGSGDFDVLVDGSYGVRLPAASIDGTLSLSPEGASLEGRVGTPEDGLTVSMDLRDKTLTAKVGVETGFTDGIDDAVLSAFDRQASELEAALQQLEQATKDYRFEASLRGLRPLLPGIVDTAVRTLNGVPNRVHSTVRGGVIRWIKGRRYIDLVVNESAIGNSLGNQARNTARSEIRGIVSTLNTLKAAALQADDASLRAALKSALNAAYARRTYSRTFAVSFRAAGKTWTPFRKRLNFTVIPADKAALIRTAANNVDRIQATSSMMINANTVIEALPTTEAIDQARAEVTQGLQALPTVGAIGFTVTGTDYQAFVELNGHRKPVTFNVLNPIELLDGISDLMVAQVAR